MEYNLSIETATSQKCWQSIHDIWENIYEACGLWAYYITLQKWMHVNNVLRIHVLFSVEVKSYKNVFIRVRNSLKAAVMLVVLCTEVRKDSDFSFIDFGGS